MTSLLTLAHWINVCHLHKRRAGRAEFYSQWLIDLVKKKMGNVSSLPKRWNSPNYVDPRGGRRDERGTQKKFEFHKGQTHRRVVCLSRYRWSTTRPITKGILTSCCWLIQFASPNFFKVQRHMTPCHAMTTGVAQYFFFVCAYLWWLWRRWADVSCWPPG